MRNSGSKRNELHDHNEIVAEMALTRIFQTTLISGPVGPVVKRWPNGAEAIKFQLDDSQFSDPAHSVVIRIQCSWNGPNGPWKFTDDNTWQGGAKSRGGESPSVVLGPFRRGDLTLNPAHVRFFSQPGPGSPPVTVGLLAEITEL